MNNQEIIELDDDDDETINNNNNNNNSNNNNKNYNNIFNDTEEDQELYKEYNSPKKKTSTTTTTTTTTSSSSKNIFNFDQTPQKITTRKSTLQQQQQQQQKSINKKQDVHNLDSDSDREIENNNKNNNIIISETPIKNNEEKKRKRKQKSDTSAGQTSITEYLDKSNNSDDDSKYTITDESFINSDDEKEFETTFTIEKKIKKPTPPQKKSNPGNNNLNSITTTSRARINRYTASETNSYLSKPGEDQDNSSEENSSSSSSSSSLYSSSSSSTSLNKKSKKGEKKEKITEKSLRKEAYISFDNSFKDIPGHNKDMVESLKDQDIENIEYRDNGIKYSIRFIRKKEDQVVIEKFIIIFIPVDEFVDLVRDNQTIDYIKSIKEKNPNANYTLLIEGLDKYLKNRAKDAKDKLHKNLAENVPIDTKSVPERATINKLFIEIQLTFGFTIKTIEERSDIVSVLSKFYEIIVKKPLKSETPLFKGFCADSIKKKTKDISLTEIWSNQLCQITGISQNIARAIVNVYPTISSLYKRFNSLSTQREKELALKDLLLETANGQQRKLGEVLSIRIYNIFNSTDPNKIVNI